MADSVYRDTPFWALIARDGLRVVVAGMEVPAVLERLDRDVLVPYGAFPMAGAGAIDGLLTRDRSVTDAVAEAVAALDVDGPLLADAALPAAAADALRARIGVDRLALDGRVFERARARKDERALACLRRANELVEGAIEEALDSARLGTSERDLAVRVQQRILAGGGRPMLHVVGIGERGALPEAWPWTARSPPATRSDSMSGARSTAGTPTSRARPSAVSPGRGWPRPTTRSSPARRRRSPPSDRASRSRSCTRAPSPRPAPRACPSSRAATAATGSASACTRGSWSSPPTRRGSRRATCSASRRRTTTSRTAACRSRTPWS